MADAGMPVLRTWITGHSAGQKGSSNEEIADLEAGGLGNYDNTKILEQIDQLMVRILSCCSHIRKLTCFYLG